MNRDVETLKLLFPEEALLLEGEQVRHELQNKLGLQAELFQVNEQAHATITLNDGYRIVLRPDQPGFNRVRFWLRWREFVHPENNRVMKMSQYRCTAHLYSAEEDFADPIFSMGVEASSMEQLVPKVLEKIENHAGLRLVALPMLKKSTN